MPDRNIPTQRNSPKSLTCNGKEGVDWPLN